MFHLQNNRKKRKLLVLFFFLFSLILLSLCDTLFLANDPNKTNAGYMMAAPSSHFPFGTDRLGRCIYSRVLAGAKTTILSSLILVLITMVLGTFLGILAGYYGGIWDFIIMRIADIMLAFPQMVLAIAVAGILGGSMINAMIALGIAGWTLYARLARGKVLSLKNEEFIYAARLGGNSNTRIMFVHVLPNLVGELIVNASIQIGSVMLGFAGLSYLGLGVQVPKAEWGSMVSEGLSYMQQAPWAVLAPGLALFLTVVIFNLFGEALSDYMGIRKTEDGE